MLKHPPTHFCLLEAELNVKMYRFGKLNRKGNDLWFLSSLYHLYKHFPQFPTGDGNDDINIMLLLIALNLTLGLWHTYITFFHESFCPSGNPRGIDFMK